LNKELDPAFSLLESLPKYDVKPGLSRIRHLLDGLGNPEEDFRTIHIAGSNGKGSVLALLSSILKKNFRVGEFVSPPLVNFSERIKIDGEEIGGSAITEGINYLEGPLEELRRRDDPPSFFEATTALAAWYFSEQGVEVGLMEAGLGGRYDATNPVGDPLVAAVTSVDLEHQYLLGETIEEIAGELSGIAKPGKPLVVNASVPETKRVFREECRETGCDLTFVEEETELKLLDYDWYGSSYGVESCSVDSLRGRKIEIGLPGTYQKRNLATALSTVTALEGTSFYPEAEEIISSLKDASWPGRFQLLEEDPHFLVDGAHNEAAIEVLVDELEIHRDLRPKSGSIRVVFSALKDKNLEGMLSKIGTVADKLYLTELDHRRAFPLRAIKDRAEQLDLNFKVVDSPGEAFKIVRKEAEAEDLIPVTGSLYLVREAIVSEF
jgi:dihydrofolate synthase/folylpolyglutamate synthase